MGKYIGTAPAYGVLTKQSLTPNGSTTTFTLNYKAPGVEALLVVYGGVVQVPGTDYTLASGGTQIVFTVAPPGGFTLYVLYLGRELSWSVSRLANNSYLVSDDTTTGALNLIKGDASNNTFINAKTSQSVKIGINDSAIAEITSGGILPALDGNNTSSNLGTSARGFKNQFFSDGTNRSQFIQSNGFYISYPTGQSLIVRCASTDMWSFNSSGQFTQDATNGGDIVFNKGLRGIAANIGTLAGTGSSQSDAAAIVTSVVRVTGADGAVGVKLPALASVSTGFSITIINSSTASALKVYSNASGETMTGQSGTTAISVAAKLFLRCWKYDASNWYVEKGVAAY